MKETLTSNAQAILDVVRTVPQGHPTALEVYDAVRVIRPHIGLASVYRILHALSEQGLIREMGRDAECCRYDGQVERHDHAICTACGTLIDLPTAIVIPQEYLEAIAAMAGLQLESHETRLYGRCAACVAQHE